MTRPVRLQLRRTAGFNLQALSLATNGLPAIRVVRPGKWGNPHVAFPVWYHGGYPRLGIPPFDAVTRADAVAEGVRVAVAMFREDWQLALQGRSYASARAELATLAGHNLACWCKPGAPCHAAVLLELANGFACEEAS